MSAGSTLTRHAVRQTWRPALLVALTAAGMSAVVAIQYRTTFADALDGDALRALAANPAIRVLFGEPVALDDPGGFTVWRTGTAIHVFVAMWALLAATRVTRGEEDTGRTDLLLAGRITVGDLTARSLLALAGESVVIAACVAVALIGTGTQPAGALVYAAGILGTALTYTTAGTLAAQVLPTRGAAAGAAGALLGTTLLLRMLSDSSDQLGWLAWLSPSGLTARALPYAGNQVGPLAVLFTVALALAAATLAATGRRDVGNALLAVRVRRRPRTRLLGTPTMFALRRALPPTIGWAIGLSAFLVLVGGLTGTILDFLRDNPRFTDLAAGAGFTGLGTTEGLSATMFALLAIPAGLYAAARIAAFAADEGARRLTGLLALPLTRARLAGAEIAVTAVGVTALATVAGLTYAIGSPLDAGSALAGVLNVVPVAVLALGAAVTALGWRPHRVMAIGSIPVAGGFLLLVLARSINAPAWVGNLSPFAHLAAVPASPPAWTATLAFCGIGAAAIAFGLAGLARRDLTT